jgi:hypothetical protein
MNNGEPRRALRGDNLAKPFLLTIFQPLSSNLINIWVREAERKCEKCNHFRKFCGIFFKYNQNNITPSYIHIKCHAFRIRGSIIHYSLFHIKYENGKKGFKNAGIK